MNACYKRQKTYLGVTEKSQSVLPNENTLKTSSLIEEALQFKHSYCDSSTRYKSGRRYEPTRRSKQKYSLKLSRKSITFMVLLKFHEQQISDIPKSGSAM
jgi:hypothetical protein